MLKLLCCIVQVPVNISATAGVSALAASQASNALVGGASNVNSGAAQLVPHQRGILKTLV